MKKQNPILGGGNFTVSACKGENKLRGKFYALAITPHEGEYRKVGQTLSNEEKILFINDEEDIAIYFTNIEAIDVVINNLNKVKKFIQDDNSMEEWEKPKIIYRRMCPSKPEYPNELSLCFKSGYFKEKLEPAGWKIASKKMIKKIIK